MEHKPYVSIPTHHLIGHVIVGVAMWVAIIKFVMWVVK